MVEAAADRSAIWDVIVVGGGATGLGIAVDAASRGYRTLLIDQHDFGKGTSSRSTKLIHGGVRYLQQGNIKLVREALYERGLLLRHARHLVHPLSFVIPNYSRWSAFYYGVGLKAYDVMAGRYRMAHSGRVSRNRTLELLPTLNPDRLVGGTQYADGQFDDARLAITLARTAANLGAILINYMVVLGISKTGDRVTGVTAVDKESGAQHHLQCRALINATGVFADSIRRMDAAEAAKVITPSQGAHIVLPRSFLPGTAALMVPKTDDKRVLFAIPWHGRVLVGTTDTPVGETSLEPRSMESEIDFLLAHTARYLTKAPHRSDILCTFAGLRPLAKPPDGQQTALIPRDHLITVSKSGLITVAGGKWTTYRRMAQDTVDRAIEVGSLTRQPCRTHELGLHGSTDAEKISDPLAVYGSDAPTIRELARQRSEWGQRLHPDLPYIAAEVIWAARQEMARTVEDVLARRTRALFLDASASLASAPAVASLLANELGRDSKWQGLQVQEFEKLVQGYVARR